MSIVFIRNSFDQRPIRSMWKIRRSFAFFLRLIENPSISDFLDQDEHFRCADKFLLAMVFVYFCRANFREENFTKENFYIALWLAHDAVEEDLKAKFALLPWAFQIDDQRESIDIKNDFKDFLNKKNQFWSRIDFRARVTREQCETIFSFEPNLRIWRRQRSDDYQMKFSAPHRLKSIENLC